MTAESPTPTDTSVTRLHQRLKKMCGRKIGVILRARGPEYLPAGQSFPLERKEQIQP